MSREAGIDAARLREILDLALERPAGEREAYVAGLCAGDDRLFGEATSLLRALDRAGDLLEPPHEGPEAEAAPLTGLCFGHYRVGQRLGEGGMGVVYAAEDTSLGRTVAVKVLPAHLVSDDHRRARLEHEARVLARLNHPNIATIYGIEQTERGPVLVLEHVGGETLAERLRHKRLAPDEARTVARQVLLALEAAHAADIIHRDIKPANIKVTPELGVKVLDFGIAKRTPTVAPTDETAHGPMTAPGVPIGTVAYMSPEQLRGRSVDRRTDLWSFGCVLFEMLAGQRVFADKTTSDTIAAVLRAEPDWSALPAQTPEPLRRLLRRCLEKEPARRLRDAGDALLELDEPGNVGTPPQRRRARGVVAVAAGALLAGAALTGVILEAGRTGRAGSVAERSTTRFSIELPAVAPLWMAAHDGAVAVSPDGSTVVYSAGPSHSGPRLLARRLDGLEPRPIAGTEGGVKPFFSPDGEWIGFVNYYREEQVLRVPTDGGLAQPITTVAGYLAGTSWGDDGTIVLVAVGEAGLRRVPATGGATSELTRPDASANELVHAQPEYLPGAAVVLYTCLLKGESGFESCIDAVWVDGGRRRRVVAGASQARFVAPGTLLYVQGGSLMAAPFDPGSAQITGKARTVLTGLAGDEPVPFRRYAASRNGRTLAYLPGGTTYLHSRLARFDLVGTATTVFAARGAVDCPRFSPDGRRIAVAMGWDQTGAWIHDLERGTTTPLTSSGGVDYPIWSADGRRVAYRIARTGEPKRIEWAPADGSAPAEVLWTFEPGSNGYPTCFTPEGSVLALTIAAQTEDIHLLAVGGSGADAGRAPRPMLTPPAHRLGARFSPDGKLVLYTSLESGRFEVCVQPYPELDRKIQVSVDGGYRPTWSGDGRRIFFRYLDRVYSADVTLEPELAVSRPRLVLEHLPDAKFDVAPDGESVVMGCPAGEWGPQVKINVMVDWR